MYLWDEITAKRISWEFTSCISHFLSDVDDCLKKVIMLRDNCFGQNNNLNLVLVNLFLIHQDKFDEKIYVFMLPGFPYFSTRTLYILRKIFGLSTSTPRTIMRALLEMPLEKTIHGGTSH